MLYEQHHHGDTAFAQTASNEPTWRSEATLDYDIAELFADSPADARRRKRSLVERVGNEMWARHGVLVDDDQIHACLARSRDRAMSVGRILAVDRERGLVVQSLGRKHGTLHNLSSFPVTPALGAVVTITYRGGALQCVSETERGRAGLAR
jgi:hypothetical protein